MKTVEKEVPDWNRVRGPDVGPDIGPDIVGHFKNSFYF